MLTNQPTEKKTLEALQRLQLFWRSKYRKKYHHQKFRVEPQQTLSLFNKIPWYKTFLNAKSGSILTIMQELAQDCTIVNNEQFHWTSESNLQSILKHQYFYGNKTLVTQKMTFQKNALASLDIANGDGNVICFSPYMVDYLAIFDNCKKAMKHNMVRLVLDVNKVGEQGKYNQFFKLFDLCAPFFTYEVQITQELSIKIKKNELSEIYFSFILNGREEKTLIFDGGRKSKHKAIIYGDLFKMNWFALNKLVEIIHRFPDNAFKQTLLKYIVAQDVPTIKKILILSAQALTVFSELNYNGALALTDHLIKEIHFAEKHFTLNLRGVNATEYQRRISKAAVRDILDLPLLNETFLSLAADFENTKEFFLYGNINRPNKRSVDLGVWDFREIPSHLFATKQYVETRPPALNHMQMIKGHSVSLT